MLFQLSYSPVSESVKFRVQQPNVQGLAEIMCPFRSWSTIQYSEAITAEWRSEWRSFPTPT